MKFVLRPYQLDAVQCVKQSLINNKSSLLVMATGLGKSVVLAKIADMAIRGRVLIIAHRGELIKQLCDTLENMTTKEIGVEMAEFHSDHRWWDKPQIVVGTIQTLTNNGNKRLEELVNDPNEWSLLIIDEAHHAPAQTYRRLVKHMQENPKHKTLGVTATPDRTDELAMGSVFDDVAYSYDLAEAIPDGWLVPIRQRSVYVEGLDYSTVRTTAGDLNGADLSRIMEEERHLHAIAAPTLELAKDRQTLVFLPSVRSAELLTEILNRYEPDCARWVCGKTPPLERYHSVQDFKESRARILVNVGVFTEGFDAPSTEVVVLARPTKSRSLFCQMVGRGTRPLPGVVDTDDADSPALRRAAIASSDKPFLEVLDFVGNAGRHKLITPMDILGGKQPDDVVSLANKIAADSEGSVDPDETLAEAIEELRLKREEEERRETARRAKLVAKAKYDTKIFNPFDVLDMDHAPTPSAPPASTKQIAILLKFGVDATDMDNKQAQRLVRTCFGRVKAGLCSIKQARILKKHGHPTDVTRDEATSIIDTIAANGWK